MVIHQAITLCLQDPQSYFFRVMESYPWPSPPPEGDGKFFIDSRFYTDGNIAYWNGTTFSWMMTLSIRDAFYTDWGIAKMTPAIIKAIESEYHNPDKLDRRHRVYASNEARDTAPRRHYREVL